MFKYLALFIFAATSLFAMAPPKMEIWAWAYPKGNVNVPYFDYAHAVTSTLQQTKDTISVPLGTILKISANATLQSGDSWYDESHYLYVFKDMPVTKTTVGSLPSLQPDKMNPSKRDIFQLIDKGGWANPNIMDPAHPGVSLQWLRRNNILIPASAGTYIFTTWARSRIGAPGGPTGGSAPVSVKVIVYALPDNLTVRASAVPASEPAKVWFGKSESKATTLPIAP